MKRPSFNVQIVYNDSPYFYRTGCLQWNVLLLSYRVSTMKLTDFIYDVSTKKRTDFIVQGVKLRHYATSRKVAGSSRDEVIGYFGMS
jgi:hypothetical protein